MSLDFEACVCCGDPIPEGTHVCRRCVRTANSDDTRDVQMDCVNYNDNGYFCELTGIECIGHRCFSLKKKVDD